MIPRSTIHVVAFFSTSLSNGLPTLNSRMHLEPKSYRVLEERKLKYLTNDPPLECRTMTSTTQLVRNMLQQDLIGLKKEAC